MSGDIVWLGQEGPGICALSLQPQGTSKEMGKIS
jgi:hypothetical protein